MLATWTIAWWLLVLAALHKREKWIVNVVTWLNTYNSNASHLVIPQSLRADSQTVRGMTIPLWNGLYCLDSMVRQWTMAPLVEVFFMWGWVRDVRGMSHCLDQTDSPSVAKRFEIKLATTQTVGGCIWECQPNNVSIQSTHNLPTQVHLLDGLLNLFLPCQHAQ